MNTSLTELCRYLKLEPQDLKLLNTRDTSNVWRQLAIWILIDPKHGVIRFTRPGSEQYHAINKVAQLYTEDCKDVQVWETAADAAYVVFHAVDTVGRAAYYAAKAASCAYCASWATFCASYAAEYAACNTAAYIDTAYIGAYIGVEINVKAKMRNKLLELINSAPPK